MQFKKRGFSLIELLIIFVLIGIVFFFVMNTINNRTNQYGTPYYVAYNALKKAAYNVLADIYCPDPSSSDAACKLGPRPFPDNTKDMCKRLTEFINVAEATCSKNSISNLADNFSKDTVQFKASNGSIYYISDKKTATIDVKNNAGAVTESEKVNYFIVYVDLNGEKHPNKVDRIYTKKGTKIEYGDLVLPDIVPFAVTTRGEVIPMGYPVIEKSYLTSRVKFPGEEEASTSVLNDKVYSDSTTFYDAFHMAWGSHEHYNIPLSIDFTKKMPAKNLARAFYQLPTPPSISSGKGCAINTYNCRATVDQSEFARY